MRCPRAKPRHTLYMFALLPILFVAIAVCMLAWLDGVIGRTYQWNKTERLHHVFGIR